MEERRRSSMFPKTLASCVEPQLRPLLKSKGLAGSRILTEWSAIVGPQLAQHSMPEKLSFPPGKKTGGTLTIAVENGFALQLQHMQPVLFEKLATYFGYKAVERITIAHSYAPTAAPKKAAPKKPVLASGELPDIAQVEDEELRAALASLARTLAGQ